MYANDFGPPMRGRGMMRGGGGGFRGGRGMGGGGWGGRPFYRSYRGATFRPRGRGGPPMGVDEQPYDEGQVENGGSDEPPMRRGGPRGFRSRGRGRGRGRGGRGRGYAHAP